MEQTAAPEVVFVPTRSRLRRLRLEWIVVGATVAIGFGLRVWAIRWGLPYADHPDEPAIANVALKMLRSGDLNPHFFLYPSFYFYILLGVFSLRYRWGVWHGLYTNWQTMPITTDVYTTIPEFFVWGRMIAVVAGSLTIAGAYALGKRAWSWNAGVFAALVIATSPFLMRHSQYVTTDVVSAWLTLLAFSGAVAVLGNGRWQAYLLAGLLAGLAASTKYNAGIVAAPIVVAHVLFWRRAAIVRGLRLIVAGVAALIGFVAGSPYVVLAWPEFRRGLAAQVQNYSAGVHGDLIGAWNIGGYLSFFWNDGLRASVSIAVLLGIAIMLRRRPAQGILWLSFAVPYLLIHLAQPSTFMRNLLPLIVLCALPAGVACAEAVACLNVRAPRLAPLAVGGVLLLVFALPAQAAVGLTMFYGRTDSKVAASNFIRGLPRGQRIAVELNPVAWSGDPIIEPVRFLTAHPAAWYRANNYRYLIANDGFRALDDVPAYAEMRREATVIKVFPGDRGGQPGPRIEVLDLGAQSNALRIVRRDAMFGLNLRLLGYEVQPGPLRPAITPLAGADARVLRPGESMQINLTWQAQQRLPYDYALFVHLIDAGGNRVAQRDAPLRQDEYPSSRWQPGEIVVDRADLPLPALPPGRYDLRIGVYRMDTGERLPLAEPAPGSDGSTLLLTTIEVR